MPAETEADGYIVNTCSVTAISDKKSRQMIRRCHKLNPNAVVAACGCYVQTHPEAVAALDVDLLAGTGDRMAFLDLFEQAAHEKRAGETLLGRRPAPPEIRGAARRRHGRAAPGPC
ncbi:MAG: hypothetical protein ACLUS6_10640 [Dysosmobacter sp.]